MVSTLIGLLRITMRRKKDETGYLFTYEDNDPSFKCPSVEAVSCEQIIEHFKGMLGTEPTVSHELLSDKVHIDVLIFRASEKVPFHVLVTSGMSDLAMAVPDEISHLAHAELVMVLPASWPMDDEAQMSDEFGWPLKLMRFIARFVHVQETWFTQSHTMPLAAPGERFQDTNFNSFILTNPIWIPEEMQELKISESKNIIFYSPVLLHPEELDYKLQQGSGALYQKFNDGELGFILNPERPSLVSKEELLTDGVTSDELTRREWEEE